MPKLNPKDAPAGFTAEPTRGEHGSRCSGCHFFENLLPCPYEPCFPWYRSDKSHVIFVKDPNYKEKPCRS